MTAPLHVYKVDIVAGGSSPMTTTAIDSSVATGTVEGHALIGLQNTATLSSFTDNKGNTWLQKNLTTYASGGGGCAEYYCANVTCGTGHTFTLTKAPGYETNEATIAVILVSDADGSDPSSRITFTNTDDFDGSITPTAVGSTLLSLWLGADYTGGNNTYSIDAATPSWSLVDQFGNSNGYNSFATAYKISTGTSADPIKYASTGAVQTGSAMYMVEVLAGGPPPQKAYPNADVSNTGWTPSTGAEDFAVVNETPPNDANYLSTDSNATVRMGLSALSTPDTGTRSFKYRISGSPEKKLISRIIEGASTVVQSFTVDPLPAAPTDYSQTVTGSITNYSDLDVEFEVADATSAPSPSVSFGAIGTGVNGSTSINVAVPTGITAGDYLTLHITSGATNSETPGTPSGWTLLATGASTDGTFGIDTGPRRATVFGKVAGASEGAVTVTTTNGNTVRGTMSRWSKSNAAYSWDVVGQGADDSTSGTGVSMTTAAIDWAVGDCACVVVGQRVDSATQSAQSLTASATTFGTRTNRATTAVTTGNDHRHVVDTFAAVTTGGGSAATTWAYTASAAVSAGGVVVRLREVPPTEKGRLTWTDFEIPAASGGGATYTGSASLSAVIQSARTATSAASAAVQARMEAPASVQAAIAAAFSTSTQGDAAIQAGRSAQSALEATILAAQAAQAVLDGAISGVGIAATTGDAAIAAGQIRQVSIDSALSAAMSAVAALSAAIRTDIVASASLSAYVTVPSAFEVVASLSAAILAAREATVSIGAAVAAVRAGSASLSACIAVPGQTVLSASADAAILAPGAASASLGTAIAAAQMATATISAAISFSLSAAATADSIVQVVRAGVSGVDSVIKRSAAAAASVSAFISLEPDGVPVEFDPRYEVGTSRSFTVSTRRGFEVRTSRQFEVAPHDH